MKNRSTPAITMEWLKTRVQEMDECWIWSGYCGTTGNRPKARMNNQGFLVRKAVWEMVHDRKFPSNKQTGARCTNQICCHPDHVIPEKLNASKIPAPLSTIHRARVAATKRAKSKVPEHAVLALRAGTLSDTQAAAMYGTTRNNAYLIRTGQSRRDYSNPYAQLERSK